MQGALSQDPGDEHADPQAQSSAADPALDEMLLGVPCWSEVTFEMASYAEAQRSCCAACAREANGEDGS